MRSLGIVVSDPLPNDLAGMGQVFKVMLPNALLIDGSNETLEHQTVSKRSVRFMNWRRSGGRRGAIPFGRVGCDEFLGRAIGFHGRCESF